MRNLIKVFLLAIPLFLFNTFISASELKGPIRIIVGFTPGGGVDTLARATAQQMEETLGVSVIVENRPGAGGTLAADYVARANEPDTTLLFGDSSLLIAPLIYPTVRYDLRNDFSPIGLVGEAGLAVAVNAESPIKNMDELLTAARNADEPLSYSSVGVGSIHHLAGELLAEQAGVELLHVPYRGGPEASQALVSKDVDFAIASLASIMSLASAEKVRLLAVLSTDRFPSLPDLATVSETLAQYEATPSLFIVAPKSMSGPVAEQLEQALADTAGSETLSNLFIAQGSAFKYQGPDVLAKWMEQEERKWKELMDATELKLD